MKNRFLAIIVSIFLIMPNIVFAEDMVSEETHMQTEETVIDDTQADSIEEVAEENSASLENNDGQVQNAQTPYKKPYSKRKIVKKFLLAMFGVGISSFLIFFCLSLYNKIRDKFMGQVKTPEGKTSLQTPDNLDSAVQTFLEKTDWKE